MSKPELPSETTPEEKPFGVAYLIGRLDRSLNRHIRSAIAPFGVTISQYTALSVFSTRGQLSNAQLAERTLVSPQAANELIKAMEKNGWIERKPDPTHGRIIQIRLTNRGAAQLAQCNAVIAELEAKMLEEFTEEECNTLQKQLRGIVRVLAEL